MDDKFCVNLSNLKYETFFIVTQNTFDSHRQIAVRLFS